MGVEDRYKKKQEEKKQNTSATRVYNGVESRFAAFLAR